MKNTIKNTMNKIIMLTITGLFLASCGGGGGSSSAVRPYINDAASAAARATPKQGSVIQSNVNNKPGLGVATTKDTVTFDSIAGLQTSFTPDESDVEEAGSYTKNGVTVDYKFYISTVENGGLGIGYAYKNYGNGANDYLAFGLWLYAPTDASRLTDIEVGFYADGGDPFTVGNIDGLTGTASYEGIAIGLYIESGDDELGAEYEGDVSLSANFETNKISGMIDELEATSLTELVEFEASEGLVINLQETDISTTSEGGFWIGNTNVGGTTDGSTYAGKWGGQFYGNGASDTDHPEYAAGTFGGAGTNAAAGDSSFVGGYIAEKQ